MERRIERLEAELRARGAAAPEEATAPEAIQPEASPPPPPRPSPEALAQLAEEAWAQESSGLETDRAELAQCLQQAQLWTQRALDLQDGIRALNRLAEERLAQAAAEFEALPEDVRAKLQGRPEALALVGKMIARLVDRLEGLATEAPELPELPQVGKADWERLLASEASEESARKSAKARLRQIGNDRYALLTDIRTLAEKRQSGLLGFVEKQVLTVPDGLETGHSHSETVIEELKASQPDLDGNLHAWFSVYRTLLDAADETLARVGVQRMEVAIGQPVDFARHEPFDTEPDDEKPNESVKAVARAGYEYDPGEGAERPVLRPAQVIVVRN